MIKVVLLGMWRIVAFVPTLAVAIVLSCGGSLDAAARVICYVLGIREDSVTGPFEPPEGSGEALR